MGVGLLGCHDDEAPELRRCVGQRLGTATDDAVLKDNNLGQRILPESADPRTFDGGVALRPGGIKVLEFEQAFGKALFEGDEAFGAVGHGGG